MAEQADAEGVASVWVAEGYYARDAWTTISAIAHRTERTLIGTGVVPVFTRHPALLAMSFATLDELSNGRVIVGIGSGERDNVSDQLGYNFERPLTAMREAITILRGLLDGEVLDFEGRVFMARKVRLSARPSRRIPIYAAAVGPKMCRLVGELADGVYYPQTSPLFIREANAHVQEGLDKSGREPGSVDIAAMIIASVHEDGAVARQVPKGLLATLLAGPEGGYTLEHNGLDKDQAGVIRGALAAGGVREAVRHVSDEMVSRLTVSGTAPEVMEQVAGLIEAGLTHPVLSALGPHAANVIPVAAKLCSSG